VAAPPAFEPEVSRQAPDRIRRTGQRMLEVQAAERAAEKSISDSARFARQTILRILGPTGDRPARKRGWPRARAKKP